MRGRAVLAAKVDRAKWAMRIPASEYEGKPFWRQALNWLMWHTLHPAFPVYFGAFLAAVWLVVAVATVAATGCCAAD